MKLVSIFFEQNVLVKIEDCICNTLHSQAFAFWNCFLVSSGENLSQDLWIWRKFKKKKKKKKKRYNDTVSHQKRNFSDALNHSKLAGVNSLHIWRTILIKTNASFIVHIYLDDYSISLLTQGDYFEEN